MFEFTSIPPFVKTLLVFLYLAKAKGRERDPIIFQNFSRNADEDLDLIVSGRVASRIFIILHIPRACLFSFHFVVRFPS